MIERLKNLYRRLDLLQRRVGFKITAAALAVVLCAGVFAPLLFTSYSVDAQRRALNAALANQSLANGDEHALSLERTGTVEVNGRTYGGERFKPQNLGIFDQRGTIAQPRVLTEMLLSDQIPSWAPDWLLEEPGTAWMLGILAVCWLLLIVTLGITVQFVFTVAGTLAASLLLGWWGGEAWGLAVAGMGLLTFTFLLLTRAVLWVLCRPVQALAVAHTVVKEASRSRLSLVFIVALLGVLPLLPLSLDPESPLRYQVQTFISRSMGLTFVIAAVLTLLLACATVAFEIRDRQIWQVMTKPVNRFSYLAGKWLGVMMVNLILLAVSGVAVFTFIQYLKQRPVQPGLVGQLDLLQLRDEVLTARIPRQPDYARLNAEQLRARREAFIAADPELSRITDVPMGVRNRIDRELQLQNLVGQRSIAPWVRPNELPPSSRSYTFSGLQSAKRMNSTLTLRYRFHILRDDPHKTYEAVFTFNDDPPTAPTSRRSTYVPTMMHSFPIGPDLIRDDGTLKVTIWNLHQPSSDEAGYGSLNFEEDGFELMYKVGAFEPNFLRGVIMAWIKLGFLAALGVACATFLSFPVSCLLSFTIFIAGTMSPFLAQSLELYDPGGGSNVDWANVGMVVHYLFERVVYHIGQVLVYLLGSFGEYRPTRDLVQGRLISWQSIFGGFARLGILWSGLALGIGYLVLRKRELAIYSGHG